MYWDMLIGNAGDAQLNSMKISLSPSEISSLRKSNLVLNRGDGKKVMEIVSASIVFYPNGDVMDSHNLALCLGNTVIGGWSNAFQSKSTSVSRATLLENYSYSPDDNLILKCDRDLQAINATATIFISYRLLSV